MALSGSFGKNVNGHWRLQIDWSATQDISGNKSDVTAKMYWIARDDYGAVYSSATKTCAMQYNNGSFVTRTASGMAALKANQKKWIQTYEFTINHDDDGKGNFSLDGYFDAEVDISGWVGRIDLDQQSFTLNTIPRQSHLTSSPSWTAGSNRTITIKRYSSRFRHEVEMYVFDRSGDEQHVNQVLLSTSETSKSTSFSLLQNTNIFELLDGRSSAPTHVILQTYDGDNWIGSRYYDGTLTAPSASKPNSKFDHYVYVDDTISGTLDKDHSDFEHNLRIKLGSYTKTFTDVDSSFSWTPDATEKTSLYDQMPNDKSKDGSIEVETFYNGIKVRSTTSELLNFNVRNSNPIFEENYTYADTNQTTKDITLNDQYIISNHSNLVVTIPASAKATAQNGASMVSYSATIAGTSKNADYSSSDDVQFDFGSIDANNDQSLVVKAVDSRGLTTTTSIPVDVIPYSNPSIVSATKRLNGFEETTTVQLKGDISLLSVDNEPKNVINQIEYRYKDSEETGFGFWTSLDHTLSGGEFSSEKINLTLDSTKAYNFEFRVMDELGSTTITQKLDTGQPLFFIDPILKSIGINDFPTNQNELLINSRLRFGANKWASNVSEEDVAGAMDLNNSDIVGLNGLFFNDYSGGGGEGLNFLKNGVESGSTNPEDYDLLRVQDGVVILNGNPIGTEGYGVLWEGALYVQASQTITPSKKMSECPNGWILVWSGYTGSADNSHWGFTHVPKEFANLTAGGMWCINGTTPISSPETSMKYVYCSDTEINGHDRNREAPQDLNVLRYVLSY
ncbi:hypothetical protein [Halobacillus sp. Marseille-P3879]|uniref:hypothetical protein n=1 Tax=Halobacillus sp. Marseille-P3879 TaxID=2045014 RepID=UPI000C7AAC2D|nr:hypothetical protein [Halobacillus sp. Marseille-P3879]